ncbi:MAG: GNAT family N-acetyltransferase, partial [Chitinivibrionales bacterium]|nr:GNAT family N-acetyltransferase [Chitinivibrionales bacterium]
KSVSELRERLREFNKQNRQDTDEYHEYLLAYEDDDHQFSAGISFSVYGLWLDIKVLFIEEAARRKGLGTRLLKEAEEFGREKGCTTASLCTFSFQARPFYEKMGYRVVYAQHEFPRTGVKYFMEKQL